MKKLLVREGFPEKTKATKFREISSVGRKPPSKAGESGIESIAHNHGKADRFSESRKMRKR